LISDTRPTYTDRRRARRRTTRALVALVITGAAVTAALVVDCAARKTITLDVNGAARQIRTRADTVQSALDDADIRLDPEDTVLPPLDAPIANGDRITVRKAFAVAIEADGSARQIRTQSAHPLVILAEQMIRVGPYDVILVDGQEFSSEQLAARAWPAPPTYIRVIRSATLRIIVDSRVLLIHTTQADVGRALDSVGLELYLADRVTPALSAPVKDGLAVRIERSVPVTVIADGHQVATRALGPTVGDALASIGLAPVDLDYAVPAEDAPLDAGMTIRLVRVSERIVAEREPIPFETIRQPDSALLPGEERVIQPGADGLRERRMRARYEDGQEVSREIHMEWVIAPPTPRIIAYGPPDE